MATELGTSCNSSNYSWSWGSGWFTELPMALASSPATWSSNCNSSSGTFGYGCETSLPALSLIINVNRCAQDCVYIHGSNSWHCLRIVSLTCLLPVHKLPLTCSEAIYFLKIVMGGIRSQINLVRPPCAPLSRRLSSVPFSACCLRKPHPIS
jgi:hypothetical protein